MPVGSDREKAFHTIQFEGSSVGERGSGYTGVEKN
jgi:hypothetical protein